MANKEILDSLSNRQDFTEEQIQALLGAVPMTQELFESCLRTCVYTGQLAAFDRLLASYPAFRQVFWEKEQLRSFLSGS